MTTITDTPRIYVACLASYNHGRLHGAWIDADQPAEELAIAVQRMLDRSPTPGAEEYAIHDAEGFGIWSYGEHRSLEDLSLVAGGIVEHGEAFAAFVEYHGLSYLDTHTLNDDFLDSYQGTYDSVTDFAEELLDDTGETLDRMEIPAYLRPYVTLDYEAFGSDLILSGDYWYSDAPTGVHVFAQHV